jgi:thiol-disulfide isomerase/thioredoxin
MENFKKMVEWLANNKKVIGYFFIVIFFVVLSVKVYKRYTNGNNNFSYYEGYSNEPNSGAPVVPGATLRMFSVDWCPHCKKAAPVFEEVRREYDGKIVNGHKLVFEVINAEDPKHESLVNEFKVTGYPTVIFTKNNKNIEYESKVDRDLLKLFIDNN